MSLLFLCAAIALGTLGCGILALVAQWLRHKARKALGFAFLGSFLALLVVGRLTYQVHWLDEKLNLNACDPVEVKDLLDRGADPNDVFQGETALDMAQDSGCRAAADLIRRAGGKRSGI